MRQPLVTLVLVLLVIAGCSGDESPVGPLPPTGNLEGTYASAELWNLTYREPSGGSVVFRCPGTIVIGDEEDDSFSGTWTVQESVDCAGSTGPLVDGMIGLNGAVSFRLVSSGSDAAFFEAVGGCSVTSAGEPFSGSIRNRQIAAAATADVQCPEFGDLALDVLVSGTRQ